ncbi:Aldo-Keto reductase family 1 member b10 [Plakobranchus ocellatus]|uniref:Aldo-Keto reductase family 1 member b10 n=1 Tax=Plakobranchus ocellatus TaxID=259542 RepID=A0AAV3YXH2_9GAST|nr:Aldo-Keto reductase family 1 member b10 [Plakobranchus ocellatus]
MCFSSSTVYNISFGSKKYYLDLRLVGFRHSQHLVESTKHNKIRELTTLANQVKLVFAHDNWSTKWRRYFVPKTPSRCVSERRAAQWAGSLH